ncbi:MAG: type III toxin-antitoxin system ToxN/AbiQ family toxin [Thomasclavelia ramosa]
MKEKNPVYKLVIVDTGYCDFLRKYDYRVSYNANEKELRPFVGVLFTINNCKYFAPLSSPKPKHLKMKNQIDFYKIDSGKLGAINFNNMIPIPDHSYTVINTNAVCLTYAEKRYQNLLRDQLRWLNREGQGLREKAMKLYIKRTNNTLPERVAMRCCDFLLLEEKSIEFGKNYLNEKEKNIDF